MVNASSVLIVSLLLQVPPPPLSTNTPNDDPLRGTWIAIFQEEADQLGAFASRLEQEKNLEGARRVRSFHQPKPESKGATCFIQLGKVVPPTQSSPESKSAEAGPEPAWEAEFQKIKEKSAEALFRLMERATAATPKRLALADACLRAIILREPNHVEARRLLGFVPHEGGWATAHARKQLLQGKVDHPIYGWVPSDWVAHLEQGELPAPPSGRSKETRWLPADEANNLHAGWNQAWRISTEHFEIKTNVPLSEAIAFSRQVEMFHDLFYSLLADLLESDNRHPLAQRLQNKQMTGERPTAPHLVYYFSGQQEYIDFLTPIAPNIGDGPSLGIYIPASGSRSKRAPAYFYRDPGGEIEAEATLFHEVSHQLLFESAGPTSYTKNVGNYWVFEGLGTYFETLRLREDGNLEVGGLVGPRLEAARASSKEGSFVKIERLVQLDQNRFNADQVIYVHYAQSMALTIFLMQGREGALRDAFLDYAKDAYRGRLRRETGRSLSDRLNVSYEELDRELKEYLE